MKKFKFSFVLGLACAAALTSGCGVTGGGTGPGGSEGYNFIYNVDGPNKVKIITANFGGGIGNLWLQKASERFAEKMQNHVWSDGRVGVYIDTKFTDFELGTGSQMASSTRNIYFDERFSDVQALAQDNLLLNLDDIVKSDDFLPEELGGKRSGGTLESKIFDSVKEGLKGNDGSFYGLPHYEYYGGLSYNREVFDKLGAYFVDDNLTPASDYRTYNPTFDSSLEVCLAGEYLDSAVLSVGPDGVPNTLDDGLPRTLVELVSLMDYIKARGYAPVALSGQYNRYCDYLVSGLWASLAGAEQMKNYYNCTGEIEIVDLDSSGNVKYLDENLIPGINYIKKPQTRKVTMKADGSEGYLGNLMAAKYYAIAVLDIIYNQGYFTDHAKVGTNTHYGAQADLFLGEYTQGAEKAAMLIEGSYWYNETEEMAKQLTKYERYSKKSASELDLRWMQLPTSVNDDDFEGKEQCLLDIGHSYAMINGNVKNNPVMKEACLDFLGFLYTEDELAKFTVETGMSRMINYDVEGENLSNFEPFYKNLYEQREVNRNNVIGLSGTTTAFTKNKSALKIELQSQCLSETAATPRTLYNFLASTDKPHTGTIFKSYYKTNASNWKM